MWTSFFFFFWISSFSLVTMAMFSSVSQPAQCVFCLFFSFLTYRYEKKTAKLCSRASRKNEKKKWKNAEQQYTQIRQRSIDRYYSVCVCKCSFALNHRLLYEGKTVASFSCLNPEPKLFARSTQIFYPILLYGFEPFLGD